MASAALDKALNGLDQAVQAVHDAAQNVPAAADAIGAAAHGVSGGAIDPFIFRFAIFVLAIFVGYYVVWSVTPALHTPLMAVTNAISSVIVVGALLAVGDLRFGLRLRARLRGAGAGLGEHLRRLPRHPAHAGHVQEKREVRAGSMSQNLAAFLYLVSGVLFILALRGLSHPTTSRRGNILGMVGMAIAILTTLFLAGPSFGRLVLIIVGIAIGGGAGAYIARRIPMTAMPQLVAAFHSLVGLAAVLVAAGALYAPTSFGIGEVGAIEGRALIEMSIGVAIGAITFTGSIIAFLKLDGRMSGKPIMLPGRHVINAGLAILLVVLIVVLVNSGSHGALLAHRAAVAGARRADHRPDRRRRHAGRHLDAELLFGLGGGRHRLHARQPRADHHRRAGRLVGRDPLLHHVQGHEPLLPVGDSRRLRRRGGGRRRPTTSTARSSWARPRMRPS